MGGRQPRWVVRSSAALQALRGEIWVVDGNHWEVRDIVWGRADLLVWLNYSHWQAVGQCMKQLCHGVAHLDEPEDEQLGMPATSSRDSVFVKVNQTFRRRQEEYPVSLSLNHMEQLIPAGDAFIGTRQMDLISHALWRFAPLSLWSTMVHGSILKRQPKRTSLA